MQIEKSNVLRLPAIVFGTSSLGNLFETLDDQTKFEIVKESVQLSGIPVVFDSAGKYGAGLALEVLGKYLRQLNVAPQDVIISNKLGWLRTNLQTAEPTFEPGVWKNLEHDAVQNISYDGIIQCFEQGNTLLSGYTPQMVSVHDPDEYVAAAGNYLEAERRYQDILAAYQALFDLKKDGRVTAVGVGAKDWKMIRRIANDVSLDWVMIANSLTIKTHPQDLLDFIKQLNQQQVTIINSAVFHSGFLAGGNYFDYKPVTPGTAVNDALISWRNDFFSVCRAYNVTPATACVQFALQIEGVNTIALNTSIPSRVKTNLTMATAQIPRAFWEELKTKGLTEIDVSQVRQ